MTKNYLQGSKLLLLNIALGLGTFIQILDTSIANVAIPYISGSLAVGPDQGTWVITSFAASNAVVLPLTGWLSDYFGRVHLFVYSLILFSVTSFLCGFSTSLTMLVIFRVFQGAVAGSLIPLSQSLIIGNSPPDKKGAALGFWAMVVVVAPVVGPILGGYISEVYSWPWIFFINVPIGLFSAAVTWFILKDKETPIVRNPIDWIGLGLLTIGIICLQIMLDKGKDLDWFESNVIITLAVISVVAIAYFIVWTWYESYPIVEFSFFKDRNFLFGTLVITLGYLIFFGSTVIVPLWLQTEQGYTAYWAGIAVAPIGIFPLLLSSLVGKNLHRFDLRFVASCSFFVFAIGYFLQAQFTTSVNIETIMFVRLIQGLGVAIFFIPLVQLSLGHIPANKYASASGIFNFFRILIGSSFGTSLSIYLWDRREIFHHSRLTEALTTYRPLVVDYFNLLSNQGDQFTPGVIERTLDQLVEQQAFMLSSNEIAWASTWIFIFMIPITFLCKKVSSESSPGGAAH